MKGGMTMAQTTNRDIIAQAKRPIEVADILREHIKDYQEKYPLQSLQYRIVSDLLNCRTAYLGGHIEKCDHCGTERITYNSCRNRHCPKCQNIPRERWLNARKAELLPVSYFHTVFTLPHDLNPIILRNKKTILNILFKSVAETLLSFGHNPKNGLDGKLGFIAILHTWDQQLNLHFHLHCLIPGGVMTEDGEQWKPCKNQYLFNEEALGLVFRGKFIEYLVEAYQNGTLSFPGIIAPYEKPQRFSDLKSRLYSHKWVVNVQEPIKRPEYVLEYLGRYTHRVAISNHRIVALKEGRVTFTYRNRKTNQIVHMTIEAVEFIRRFLLHVLPGGFVRIRHFGFLANRNKANNLARLRCLLGPLPGMHEAAEQTLREMMLLLTGIDLKICPHCKKGKMRLRAEISPYTGLSAKQIIRQPIPSRAAA
jgi:hypothetical protein